jgi:hypothetical protein
MARRIASFVRAEVIHDNDVVGAQWSYG